MKKHKRGLKVVISETEDTTLYHVYGDLNKLYHKYLSAIVESKGGFKSNLRPGVYEYRLKRKGFKVYSRLSPWID